MKGVLEDVRRKHAEEVYRRDWAHLPQADRSQDCPASGSSHGWQRARRLVRTAGVMGSLLDDVRSKEAESVYLTDWTHVPRTPSPAAIANWHRLRSVSDAGHVFENMLNRVRNRQMEELYSSDWSKASQGEKHPPQ